MDLKAGVYTFLSGFPSLTALIGTGTSFRLYPDFAPENAVNNVDFNANPFITYGINGVERPYHLTGASPVAWAYFYFTIFAPDSVTRNIVKECLRNILHGRQNFILNDGTNSISINSCVLTSESDSYDPPDDGSDIAEAFACDLEFTFAYIEPLPTHV